MPTNPRQPDVRCVLRAHAVNGESPAWCAEEARLYWIDLLEPTLHRFDPATGRDEAWRMPSLIGCAAPAGGGRVLVALRGGVARFDTASGALDMLAPVPFDARRFISNDGKCDPQGRLWFGPMHRPLEPVAPNGPRVGPLLRFDPATWRLAPMTDPMEIANGLAWSPDGRTMYHAHTQERTIYAYEFDGRDGTLGERRVFARVDAAEGNGPDGGATDMEGCYWSAIFGEGKLLRFDPDGRVEREIKMPVARPTMPAFGGADLRTIYVTSARKTISTVQRILQPRDGGLFAIEAPAPGVPVALAAAKYFEEPAAVKIGGSV